MTVVVHIAGPKVLIGGHLLRQRCAWCGALLIDYDLNLIQVPLGQDPMPATWPEGDLVARDGALWYVVDHVDGADLPEGACAKLDPAVTR